MNFHKPSSIYIQISESIIERILSDKLKEGDKLKSIRDFAEEINVNPNTIMKSYSYLSTLGIIANRRGLGFYVMTGTLEKIKSMKRKEFFEQKLPEFFRLIEQLEIDLDSLAEEYQSYSNN